MVDEYGGIEGLLTLNDMLSDAVGEVDDPHATNVKGGVQREDGSWYLEGGFPGHELRELFDIETLPGVEEGRYETIGGCVMDRLGHIPETAEACLWNRFRFEVVDMDGMRIDKVLVAEVIPGNDSALDAATT